MICVCMCCGVHIRVALWHNMAEDDRQQTLALLWQRVTCMLFLFFLGLMFAGFGMAANQPVNKTSTCAYTFRGTKYQYKLMSCCDQRQYKCNDEMFKDCTRPLPSCEEYKSVLGTAALMILSGIIGSVVSCCGATAACGFCRKVNSVQHVAETKSVESL